MTLRGDPYESHDPVFGVKNSLLSDLTRVDDESMAKKCDIPLGTNLLYREFVMTTNDEASELRRENAKRALATAGEQISFIKGRPVPSSYGK